MLTIVNTDSAQISIHYYNINDNSNKFMQSLIAIGAVHKNMIGINYNNINIICIYRYSNIEQQKSEKEDHV